MDPAKFLRVWQPPHINMDFGASVRIQNQSLESTAILFHSTLFAAERHIHSATTSACTF